MTIKFKNRFAIFSALCAMAVLIMASGEMIESARYALDLCLRLIIPSLLPFFVLSSLLSSLGFPALVSSLVGKRLGRAFGVSGKGVSALIVSLLGGYPLGAQYIAQLNLSGQVSDKEAERLLAFCNNSGPAFIIGAVGAGVFASSRAGAALYLIHIISALCTGLIISRLGKKAPVSSDMPDEPSALEISPMAALTQAVKSAVPALLSVCGFIVCFTVFAAMLNVGGGLDKLCAALSALTGLEERFFRSMLTGLLELGSGVGVMEGAGLSRSYFALCAALLGFGGASVHFQTAAVLSETNIKSALHFAGHLVNALVSALLALAVYGVLF